MSTKVLLKKSSVSGKSPIPSDLSYGELALNYADGRLYFKNSSDQIVNFSAAPTLDLVTDNNSVTTNSITIGGLSIGGQDGYTFPSYDGIVNQILVTDGNGNLQWTNQPTGGTGGGGTGTSGLIISEDSFTSNGVTTQYTLSATPLNSKYCSVTINGLKQSSTSYSVSGSTLTLGFTPNDGDLIEILTYTGDITNTINSINDLSDVDTSTVAPEVGQVLKWNGVNWVPSNDESGSGLIDADTLNGFNSSYFLNYNNLTNTPSIPDDVSDLSDLNSLLFSGNYNDLTNKPTLFSGSYNDLTNKPFIPVKLGDLTNDIGYITAESDPIFTASPSYGIKTIDITEWNTAYGWGNHASAGYLTSISAVEWTQIANKPDLATTTYVTNQISSLIDGAPGILDTLNELANALGDDANFATTVTNSLALKANTADLATVATSGSYTDLINKPTIPAKLGDLINDVGYLTSSSSIDWSQIVNEPTLFSGSYNDLTDKPTLFSGDYNDLSNKPEFKTINGQSILGSGNIVITGGISSESDPVYAGSSWYNTTNNSSNWDTAYSWGNHASAGYLTATSSIDWSQIINEPALFSGSYNDLTDKPTIPTLTSQLTNNSGFITNVKTINGQSLIGTGNITISGGAGESLYTNSASTASTQPDQFVDSFALTQYRTVKYIIQATSDTAVSSSEFTVMHNDVSVFTNESNVLNSGTTKLYTVGARISGTDAELTVTPAVAGLTIDVTRISIISRPLGPTELALPTDLEIESFPIIDLELDSYPTKDLN